jgi:hypothetical protein
MADTSVPHRINARTYTPPVSDRLGTALASPRVQEAMDKSRAILAGIRQERAEATYQQHSVFSRDPKQFRIWLWTVGITLAVIALCLCGAALL